MTETKEKPVAVPGEMRIVEGGKETKPVVQSAFSSQIPFDQAKQHLSDKPLRRPNRTRPIDPPALSADAS